MFIHNESKKHLDAKNALCDMYNALGEGYMALVEVPLMKYNIGYTWYNTWTGLEWRTQSQVPDYNTCKLRYGTEHGPFAIADVAVYQHCRLKYLIEICATNPVSNEKINRIKQEGLKMFEVSADDVIAMEVKNRDNLKTIVKRLC
jgi:hypothetical protein